MVTNFISNFLAIWVNSGNRAMVPSSLNISTIHPAGSKPAKRAKSIAASVCPALRKTPSGCAFKGNICPGLPNSSGFVFGSIND